MRLIRDPSNYNYIRNSTSNNQTSSNDKSDYKAVLNAMATLGFMQTETQTIWNVVAGVLHLVKIFYT
jgi:myosin-1